MLSYDSTGSFKNTEAFLNRMSKLDVKTMLERYGQAGVDALSQVTPRDSGETATSWRYEVKKSVGRWSINWYNTHRDGNGPPVAILIQYGHATRNGGYVQGRDFINPVIKPIFDQIATEAWKEVTRK